jgi:hypothetical protein
MICGTTQTRFTYVTDLFSQGMHNSIDKRSMVRYPANVSPQKPLGRTVEQPALTSQLPVHGFTRKVPEVML